MLFATRGARRPSQKPLAAALLSLCAVPALGQDGAMVLEEVIVTAQKKSESLADIPMTVNAISGDQLNQFASFELTDLEKLVSGFSINGQGYDTEIAVRGMGTDLDAAVSPRVTIYWDGAYVSQERGLFAGLFDLERLELLRGPQGTLYGKASPAGAITMQSRSPNMEVMDGYVQQSFSQRGGSNTQFGVSIPIIKNELSVRVAGLYSQDSDDDVENLTTGNEDNDYYSGGRVVVSWVPSDVFDLRLSYTQNESDLDVDQVLYGNGIDVEDRVALGGDNSWLESRSKYAVLEMNYTLPNDWILTSVSSYQEDKIEQFLDYDFVAVRGGTQYVPSDVSPVKNTELRLASIGNDLWDWTAGLFYAESKSLTGVDAQNWIAPLPGINVKTYTTGPATNNSDGWGAFLHNSFDFSEAGVLTVGLRYTYEDRFSEQPFETQAFLLQGDGTEVGPVQVITRDGVAPEDQQGDEGAWTGTLKYQYNLSMDMMVYGSYDRGWRSGAANISARAQPTEFGAFDSETSDNLELGMKWSLMESRGLLNLAAYYQTYSDYQYQTNAVAFRQPAIDGGGIGQTDTVVNVGEAETMGVEAEFSYLIDTNWLASLSASYNDTEFTDAKGVPCSNGEPIPDVEYAYNTCDLTGEPAGRMPQWSAVLTSEYSLPVSRIRSEWYLRGLLKAESSRFAASIDDDLPGYAFLDLYTGLRALDGSWDVFLWGKNLFDRAALLQVKPIPPVLDPVNSGTVETGYIEVQNQLAPRIVGVTAKFNF
ncbi:TonB-dependent receptor [Parahaliea mediterranea]|uniref:TonB-dependent receptor n=1 Tax=Parahaliea mediterranea TaxID=651086 RepID=UPI001472E549|nr:TonB-dependent receptor [Parahaliea mediterranea]